MIPNPRANKVFENRALGFCNIDVAHYNVVVDAKTLKLLVVRLGIIREISAGVRVHILSQTTPR